MKKWEKFYDLALLPMLHRTEMEYNHSALHASSRYRNLFFKILQFYFSLNFMYSQHYLIYIYIIIISFTF